MTNKGLLQKSTINVYVGPMQCGKTDEFIRLYKRAKSARQVVFTFKSPLDFDSGNFMVMTRNNEESIPIQHEIRSLAELIEKMRHVVNRVNRKIVKTKASAIAKPFNGAHQLLEKLQNIKDTIVVLVDESQFLDRGTPLEKILQFCQEIQELADEGIQFHFFGLNQTWQRKPYATMGALAMSADNIYCPPKPLCSFCRKEGAVHSKAVKAVSGSYDSGKDNYYCSCRKCYNDPNQIQNTLDVRYFVNTNITN